MSSSFETKAPSLEEVHFNLIDKFFKESSFVDHHIDSVNQFYKEDIPKIFNDLNPIRFSAEYNKSSSRYQHNIELYFGGVNVDKIYYGKPILYEQDKTKILYPNEARLRNLTYAISIHVDIDVKIVSYNLDTNGNLNLENLDIDNDKVIEKYYLGMFPIMLQSICVI